MHPCPSGAQVGVVKRGSRLERVWGGAAGAGLRHFLGRDCWAGGSEVPRFCHWLGGGG